MLSLPDFRQKQILFIRSSKDLESNIKFHNENITYLENKKIINQLSIHKIFCIFIIGDCSITTKLFQNCVKYGITLVLLKNNFESYAMIASTAEGNYLLRKNQYTLSTKHNFTIAKNLIKNKITNQIILLKEKKINNDTINNLLLNIDNVKTDKQLLGIEGNASKIFFTEYFKEMNWYKRMPRVKPDINNLLLDIGYTFLFNFTDALLRLYGFDTYKGCYHKLFFQRKSLSCDVMEPLRCIIEKQLLKSFHLKQINNKDFIFSHGQFILKYDNQKKYAEIFLQCLMDRKEDIYNFIKNYYYYIIKNNIDFPTFNIK